MSASLSIQQVSKITGLTPDILQRMRSRETVSLLSGPPFCKEMDADGNAIYRYDKAEIKEWIQRRRFRITALDAARMLRISRAEILKYHGVHSWESAQGKLVINPGKNVYIWIPKAALIEAKKNLRKKDNKKKSPKKAL